MPSGRREVRSRPADNVSPARRPASNGLFPVLPIRKRALTKLYRAPEAATEPRVRDSGPGGCAAVPSGRPLSLARASHPGTRPIGRACAVAIGLTSIGVKGAGPRLATGDRRSPALDNPLTRRIPRALLAAEANGHPRVVELSFSWASSGWARPPGHATCVRTFLSRTDRCFGEPSRGARRHNTHSVHPVAREDSPLTLAPSPPVTSLQ